MKGLRAFKQKLGEVSRLWDEQEYGRALGIVEELEQSWPGNARLRILWASLVQLQEEPGHGLVEVRKALRDAIELDPDSPSGYIELGHFLDAVEDDPRAASRAFAEGVDAGRRLLIEGLIGQSGALLQLDRTDEAIGCLIEALSLAEVESSPRRARAAEGPPDLLVRDPAGRILAFPLKGPFSSKIEGLLRDAFQDRPALPARGYRLVWLRGFLPDDPTHNGMRVQVVT